MRKFLLIITTILVGLLNAEGFGSFQMPKQQKFLTPQEAFKVNAKKVNNGVQVDINLADKIHIYQNELKFKITKPIQKNLSVNLPKAKVVDGQKVYEGNITVTIPQSKIGVNGNYTLQIKLVGCSDAGICYSPQTYTFNLKSTKKDKNISDSKKQSSESFFSKISNLAKNGNSKDIANALKSEGLLFILLLFFIVGLLLALTPCILPMVQSVSGKYDAPSPTSYMFFCNLSLDIVAP